MKVFNLFSEKETKTLWEYLKAHAKNEAEAGRPFRVTVGRETRSQEQNRLMWPLLQLWAKYQTACVNGERIHITKEAWKVILLSSFRKRHGIPGQLAMGLDGELVPLGYETHEMPKDEFADFLTFILAETLERGMDLPQRIEPEEDAA